MSVSEFSTFPSQDQNPPDLEPMEPERRNGHRDDRKSVLILAGFTSNDDKTLQNVRETQITILIPLPHPKYHIRPLNREQETLQQELIQNRFFKNK